MDLIFLFLCKGFLGSPLSLCGDPSSPKQVNESRSGVAVLAVTPPFSVHAEDAPIVRSHS